jgi:hypothetical protein
VRTSSEINSSNLRLKLSEVSRLFRKTFPEVFSDPTIQPQHSEDIVESPESPIVEPEEKETVVTQAGQVHDDPPS